MVALPLAHISWALADNDRRKACDAFFLDVFGAETAYEMLITPETERYRFDREERLMLVGDTMLIPIAPAGSGTQPDSGIGTMLRKNALPGRWIGVSLRVADLTTADAWFRARDFRLHYDPGMESHYFLVSPRQALGMRIEVMQGELPNDLRLKPGWNPARWRDEHPLGIEGLQAIGMSVPALDEARALFGQRLEWPEIGTRTLEDGSARVAAFHMGDTVIEAMEPLDAAAPLAAHARDVQGICGLTFKVRSARQAADHLRAKGLRLIGDMATRFAIDPEQAFDRTIWFSEQVPQGYPQLGSRLREPAVF